MKQTTKKILAVMLSLLMIMTAIPVTAFAANSAGGTFFGYLKETGTNNPVADFEVQMQDYTTREVISSTKTDATGKFLFPTTFPMGIYYLAFAGNTYFSEDSEYLTSNGYEVIVTSTGENTFTKGDTKFLTQAKGNLHLKKVSTNSSATPIANVTFDLFDKNDNLLGTYVTNNAGEIDVLNLPVGDYYFVETAAPTEYFADTERKNVSIPGKDLTGSVTVTNIPKCSFTLTKKDADTNSPLAGVNFELLQNDSVIKTFQTNENGIATVDSLQPGVYTVRETAPLEDYIDEGYEKEFTLTADAPNYSFIVPNKHFPSVTISKTDANTGTFVPGAELKIMQGSTEIAHFNPLNAVTDIYLAPGNYQLIELKAPAGYVKSEPLDFSVSLDTENKVVLKNTPITAVFNKYGEDFNGTINHENVKYAPMDGAHFTLTNKANPELSYTWSGTDYMISAIPAGEYTLTENSAPDMYLINAPVNITILEDSTVQVFDSYNNYKRFDVDVTKTNTNAEVINAEFKLDGPISQEFTAGTTVLTLIPGNYTIQELKSPDGYVSLKKDISFTLTTNGTVLSEDASVEGSTLNIVNNPIVLNVEKTDAISGERVLGATLKITKNDGSFTDEFVTTNAAKNYTGVLTPGEYTLEEVRTPYGYTTANKMVFTVEDTETVQSVTMTNELTLKNISINKLGEVFDNVSSFEKFEGFFVNLFNIATQKVPLKDVEFALYANKDIPNPDGHSANLYNKDDLVATSKTNATGYAEFRDLPLGEYRVVETKTNDGYVLNDNVTNIVITPDSNIVLDMTNILKTIQINLTKTDSENGQPLKNAKFELFNTEDIVLANGVILPANSVIDVLQTNENGEAKFNKQIPLGHYAIKEIVAPEGYLASNDFVEINFTTQNENYIDSDTTMTFDIWFENTPIKMDVVKKDALDNQIVPGAKMQLIKNSDNSVIREWMTTSTPEEFYAIPAGEYTIKELTAPTGYEIAPDKVITVSNVSDVQHYDITDNRSVGSITIQKTVKGTTNPLSGVVYEVKNVSTNMVLGQFTTDENGKITIENLPVALYQNGKAFGFVEYSIKEISAPAGFIVNDNVVKVVLNVADTSKEITTNAVVSLENDYTKLEVLKKDLLSNEYLANAELAIYHESQFDENGNLTENAQPEYHWVTNDAPHSITQIPTGNYFLVELNAPVGYVKSEMVPFTVNETVDTQTVEMVNDYTKLDISKKDSKTEELLANADFSLYAENSFDENGLLLPDAQPYANWKSEATPTRFEKIPAGTYYLVENKAPVGYYSSKPMKVVVDNTTNVQSVEMLNTPTEVTINKVDKFTGEFLTGAKFALYFETEFNENTLLLNENATPIYEWVSSAEPQVFERLPFGKYLIVELEAPDGYLKAENTMFELADMIQESSPQISIANTYTTIEISKVDKENKSSLVNAKLSLYKDVNNDAILDENDILIGSWVSSEEAKTFKKLMPGQYLIVETEAPEGYKLSAPIVIQVKDTDSVQFFSVENEKIEVPVIDIEIPKTGNDNMFMYLGLLSISTMTVTGFLFLKKKKEKVK